MELTPRAWRTNNNLLEQCKFLADGCGYGCLSIGPRRDAGQPSRVRFARGRLARRPGNAVREVFRKAKRRDSIRRACVDNCGHWGFECNEFRTRVRQQVKKLDCPPCMPGARIRRRYVEGGVQVESAKFTSGVPPAAALLRILCVGWIYPVRR
jgi:hypothetical protein